VASAQHPAQGQSTPPFGHPSAGGDQREQLLQIGTCSWKYPSWRGLVYSDSPRADYLAEYARQYDCVEVDQWFWSLHGPAQPAVLPQPKTVAEYAAAVPPGFRFGIKLPNSLTLSHYRPASKDDELVANPHFLSLDLLRAFLDRLAPLRANLGPLMLQFGYLNRKMMPTQAEFQARLGEFAARLPSDYEWAVETRNPNYLNDRYFQFLREFNLAHVFLQGYYMPPIFGLYEKHQGQLARTVIIRLHGPDREGMEDRTGQDWSRIVEPRDADLDALTGMLGSLRSGRRAVSLFVNNHFEGCAPLTIRRLLDRLRGETQRSTASSNGEAGRPASL
jgi:uncharacterized protein YecE (DUF72 family)